MPWAAKLGMFREPSHRGVKRIQKTFRHVDAGVVEIPRYWCARSASARPAMRTRTLIYSFRAALRTRSSVAGP
jgi:hypothetical protein